jgi:hypothetical protein
MQHLKISNLSAPSSEKSITRNQQRTNVIVPITSISAIFAKHVHTLGYPAMRFPDLRASHGTVCSIGISVRTIAERLGHDPALLLRVFAKRTKKSDMAAADVVDFDTFSGPSRASPSALHSRCGSGSLLRERSMRASTVTINRKILSVRIGAIINNN